MASHEKRRLVALLWGVLVVLWGIQVWQPQLSYPLQGILQTGLLLALLGMAAVFYFQSFRAGVEPSESSPAPPKSGASTAAWLGTAFVFYAWARWAADGFPAVGSDNFGTLLGCAAWASAAYFLLGAWWRHGRPNAGVRDDLPEDQALKSPSAPLLTFFYAVVSVVAILGGIHALAQHRFLYDRALADMTAAMGTAEPTPLQLGIMHHLRLKRVASVWGDPNSLAGFSAFSLAASFYCIGAWRRRARSATPGPAAGSATLTILGVAGVPAALLAIALSRSRGGALAAVLVALLYTCLVLRRRSATLGRAAMAGILLLVFGSQGRLPAASAEGAVKTQAAGILPAFLTRMDTVRERVNYMKVGTAIIQRNPIFGSGLGAVDLYYGRYKPVGAREAKFLHNWILQIAAELGLVGLGLATAFLVFLLRPGIWWASRDFPVLRPVLVIAVAFLFDALIQLTYNQREQMALFGIVVGGLLHAGKASVPRPERPATVRGRWAVPAVTTLLILAGLCHVIPSLYAASEEQAAQDLMEAGDSAAAVRHLRQAAAWAPRDPAPLVALGFLEFETRGPRSGALFLERALRLQPESASLHAHLARMRLRAGQTKEAEVLARRAIELYPTNAEHHDLLSHVLEARGDMSGAVASARHAAQYGFLFKDRYQHRLDQLETRSGTGKAAAESRDTTAVTVPD